MIKEGTDRQIENDHARAGALASGSVHFVASEIASTASEVDLRIAVNRKIDQTNNK